MVLLKEKENNLNSKGIKRNDKDFKRYSIKYK